jgi:geranylgeranyl diphosphate synthase type II
VLNLDDCRALLERALAERPLPAEPAGLYAPVRYILDLGGKRLRPALALMAADAVGGRAEDALGAALAVEWFHNFSLLHDDIMDDADLRRGRDTVHVRWSVNQAILSGDVMLVQAYQHLASGPQAVLAPSLERFSRTAVEVCEGQQLDMDFERRDDVTLEAYLAMIRLKTAVLLGCSLELGALAGGASRERAAALYAFGEALGLAFQLRDDLLDTYGDPARFGKTVGGDIRQDKKTFLMLHALGQAGPEDRAVLAGWLGRAGSEEKVRAVVGVYDRCGTRAACEAAIRAEHDRALQALAATGLPAERTAGLLGLAEALLARDH